MKLEEALHLLACPKCGGDLAAKGEPITELHCEKCRATYPIRNGILDFLPRLDHTTDP